MSFPDLDTGVSRHIYIYPVGVSEKPLAHGADPHVVNLVQTPKLILHVVTKVNCILRTEFTTGLHPRINFDNRISG